MQSVRQERRDCLKSLAALALAGPAVARLTEVEQAFAAELDDVASLSPISPVHFDDTERSLLMSALSLPGIIEEAAKSYDPSLVANLCYDITKSYSSWYQNHPILNEEDDQVRTARLALCALSSSAVKNGMSLLGVSMPERM